MIITGNCPHRGDIFSTTLASTSTSYFNTGTYYMIPSQIIRNDPRYPWCEQLTCFGHSFTEAHLLSPPPRQDDDPGTTAHIWGSLYSMTLYTPERQNATHPFFSLRSKTPRFTTLYNLIWSIFRMAAPANPIAESS